MSIYGKDPFSMSKKTTEATAADESAMTVAEETVGAGKMKRVKNKKARIILLLVALALVAAIVVVMLNLAPLSAGEAISSNWNTPKYLRDKTMTVLVCGIGVDEKYLKEGEDSNTDVIMVCNFDLENKTASILQIPRDTYVGRIVEYGKINSLYAYGLNDGSGTPSEKAGIGALAEVINDQMKLPIDNYVTITMDGFVKAVDMLGGVEVTLTEPITLGDAAEGEIVTLEAGTHLLDGDTAKLFVRSRELLKADDADLSGSDIARSESQRFFMAALMQKVFDTPTTQLISLCNDIYPYVETDLSVSEIISLALMGKDLSLDKVQMVRAPGEALDYTVLHQGKNMKVNVFTVHRAELADLLNEYMRPYTDDVPEAELGVVELQNTKQQFDSGEASLGAYEGEN